MNLPFQAQIDKSQSIGNTENENGLVSKQLKVVLSKSDANSTPSTTLDDIESTSLNSEVNLYESDSGIFANETHSYARINKSGTCVSCDDIDAMKTSLSCWLCSNSFHAVCRDINGEKSGNDIICTSTFYKSFMKVSSNSGVNASRPGSFVFVCDDCNIKHTTAKARQNCDRVDLLDKKIENMNTSFLSEINELKKLIVAHPISTAKLNTLSDIETNDNGCVWNDHQKTENLKHVLSISKDKNGSKASSEILEKVCVDHCIPVQKTFNLTRSDSTGIVLKNKTDATKLTQALKNALPEHPVKQVATRVPTIHIVGLNKQFNKEDVESMLKRQNPGIATLFESVETSDDDKFLDVVAVQPLKKSPHLYKAIVRLSNVMRSILAKQGDRAYLGFQSTCKVYDSIYVLRCYKCQDYGHHSRDCTYTSVCGFCSGGHETRSCSVSNNLERVCCANCVKGHKSNTKHQAGDLSCEVYLEHNKRVRASIPFHQQH